MPTEHDASSPAASRPSEARTSPTLAEMFRLWREKRYMTPALLAQKANVPLRLVEDIEAGIECFLAPAVRQRLAKVLHVRPSQIREVEKRPTDDMSADPALYQQGNELREAILQNPDAPRECPTCGAPLSIRLFERRDLQDRPLVVIKANCTRCLFRMTDD